MWRQPTEDDFIATLEDAEADLFSRNENEDRRPIAAQISMATSHVRGCVRSGRKCRMPSDESLLPDMLIAPAMDYAAFNLLKRLRRPVNDSRTKAYERACSLFEKVAQGSIVPEDYGEDPASVMPESQLPQAAFTARERRLGRRMEDGL